MEHIPQNRFYYRNRNDLCDLPVGVSLQEQLDFEFLPTGKFEVIKSGKILGSFVANTSLSILDKVIELCQH